MSQTLELSTPIDAASGERPFGAFEYFPDNLEWSTQMMRLIAYCYVRGADFSEVHAVARSLPVGDNAAWQMGFAELASRIEAKARDSAAGGHLVTARDFYLRASIYHRISGQLADIAGDSKVPPGVYESIRCFQAAAALRQPSLIQVEVPFEDTTLPGYLCIPESASGGPVPAVIDVGGIDAFAEEQYFKIGSALIERGYAVLLLNGPGQGTAKLRGIFGRYDFEAVASAAVDYLNLQPAIDGSRISLVGSSLGGYFAARAAAFEPRLRATVIWGANQGFNPSKFAPGSGSASRVNQFQQFLGVQGLEAMQDMGAKFHLGPAVMKGVSAPVLILHGESDVLIPVAEAHEIYGDISYSDKTLKIYARGEPGCTHCQLDAIGTAQRDICDWLDDKTGPAPAESAQRG